MSTQQYDLFEGGYYDTLHGEIIELRNQLDHHRKSFFSRHNQISKLVLRQQSEIDRLRELLLKSHSKEVIYDR